MSKFSGTVFPYGVALRERGAIDVFPVAELRFRNQAGEWLSLFLIIDSGAAVSALPASDAAVLGIVVEKGTEQMVSGIGGEMLKGWRHEIAARLQEKDISFPVVFLENGMSPRVLGRAGIFEDFTVIFEERNKRSGFLGKNSRQALKIQKTLDKFQGK
jgi:hypothetical protein